MNFQERIILYNVESLQKQSRSFAIPILNLDDHLKRPIMAQYNLNKTIDTIEDSTKLTNTEKRILISKFCKSLVKHNISTEVKQIMQHNTPAAERFVFHNYGATLLLFQQLSASEQKIAIEKTIIMAEGMMKYLSKNIQNMQELNNYCYYVAGSVGEYLVELFNIHYPLKINNYQQLLSHAKGFGRFLQKLNIIRDVHEDFHKLDRIFWPKDLIDQNNSKEEVLNLLCKNTLQEDAKDAINFFIKLPEVNPSFNNFIKFILISGLEYIKILKNNSLVFNPQKIKLPKYLITSLYNNIANISKQEFINKCTTIREQELNTLVHI